MTEDEAKTKWCPMVRWSHAQGYDDVFTNREANQSFGSGVACIGSACMWWRERSEAIPGNHAVIGGYCGGAGNP